MDKALVGALSVIVKAARSWAGAGWLLVPATGGLLAGNWGYRGAGAGASGGYTGLVPQIG